MKTSLKLLTLAGLLCAGLLTLKAADKRLLGGPKGGRLLDKTEPHAELVVEKDRSVTINFYDTALNPVAATTQTVVLIADASDAKTKVEFEKKGEVLVSKTKLPDGDGYGVIIQFRRTADAKPQNFRFKLDLNNCGECKRAEYACICEH